MVAGVGRLRPVGETAERVRAAAAVGRAIRGTRPLARSDSPGPSPSYGTTSLPIFPKKNRPWALPLITISRIPKVNRRT